MGYTKVLVMMLPLILPGCSDFSDENPGSFYTPAPAPAPAPASGVAAPAASPSPAAAPADCGCSGKSVPSTPATPSAASPSAAAATQPDPDWQPLEGHLVRAGDLVMELRRSKGGSNPTHAEMAAYIQTRMALAAHQAEMVLDELGL